MQSRLPVTIVIVIESTASAVIQSIPHWMILPILNTVQPRGHSSSGGLHLVLPHLLSLPPFLLHSFAGTWAMRTGARGAGAVGAGPGWSGCCAGCGYRIQ
ncbi:hypothetical protein JB92DRAFT_2998304 [Gautieria morchelliformis]|nr:hypothetical protein JB92DRAFT_2998304 [Gautieria morchelliformis]